MKIFVYQLEPIAERSIKAPIVPEHLAHLDNLRKKGLLIVSGAFEDRTGGLVAFKAESLEKANEIANSDPFVIKKTDKLVWLKEWALNVEKEAIPMVK